jgi:hypothetical protein
VLPDARWTPTSVTSSVSPTIPDCPECNPLPATTVTAYRWANRDTSADNVLITNPDGFQYRDPNGNVIGTMNAYRKYKALMLSFSRRYADRWQGRSYVYSKAEGTRDNTSTASIAAQFTLLRDAHARAGQRRRTTDERSPTRGEGVPGLRDRRSTSR